MKKNIQHVIVTDVQDADISMDIDILPGASLLVETGEDDAGAFEKHSLSFRVRWEHRRLDILKRDLLVDAVFDDGTYRSLGSSDYPVRFNISEGDIAECSATWLKAL